MYNISTTGVIVLSYGMIIGIILMRIWHVISSLYLIFLARPRLLTLHSLVARQHELSCDISNQSRTNGPINTHLTIAQVMPKYNHNNEEQEALL